MEAGVSVSRGVAYYVFNGEGPRRTSGSLGGTLQHIVEALKAHSERFCREHDLPMKSGAVVS